MADRLDHFVVVPRDDDASCKILHLSLGETGLNRELVPVNFTKTEQHALSPSSLLAS